MVSGLLGEFAHLDDLAGGSSRGLQNLPFELLHFELSQVDLSEAELTREFVE